MYSRGDEYFVHERLYRTCDGHDPDQCDGAGACPVTTVNYAFMQRFRWAIVILASGLPFPVAGVQARPDFTPGEKEKSKTQGW